MSTTTNLDNLVINYLTQAQYATALANNQIDEDQLYFTPSSQLSSTDVTTALGYTPATNSHTHGDITNTGDITATAPTIASGDKLIINDQSANKVTNGPSFGTSTTQYLANNGTWQNVPDISGKIDTAGTGLSKSGTTLNHSNSVIAQTTQAVYPIKIDAQGHISKYGNAVSIPTKVSDLTNDSGFITSYTETDPVFSTSPAAGITSTNITNWNNKANKNIWYGTCDTAAATQAKVITTTTGDFSLITGNMIRIKFTNSQTYDGGITLNIDGTGAISAKGYGTTNMPTRWYYAGEVIDFVYDGTNFITVKGSWAGTNYYGNTKLTDSVTSTATTLAATASAVKTAYDLAASKADPYTAGDGIDITSNVISVDSNLTVLPGTIQMYAGSIAPEGFLICDGSAINRIDYSVLFSIIGQTYGAGDGVTTFNIPDLRGRVPLGVGTGTASDATSHILGQYAGEENHLLTTQEIPSHTHAITHSQGGASVTGYTTQWASATYAFFNSGSTGGDQVHNNMQPYLAINYIIATGKND